MKQMVTATPRVGGYVKEKYFGLGDVVNARAVLLSIDLYKSVNTRH